MNDEYLELLQIFRGEAADILDELILRVEPWLTAPEALGKEDLRACMRLAHNIKGAAAIVEWTDIVKLAHAIEDGIENLDRLDHIDRVGLINTLIEAMTLIQGAVAKSRPNEEPSPKFESLANALRSHTAARPATPPSKGRESKTKPTAPRPAGPAQSSAPLRVEIERVEQLMGYTSELLLTQGRLASRNERLEKLYERLRSFFDDSSILPEGHPIHDTFRKLDALIQQDRRELLDFGYLADGLNEAIRRVRMVRIDTYAHIWRRIVREASITLEKKVNLKIETKNVELDRVVLDVLVDPLTHLLRNAVDHGIETAETRRAAHKPPEGLIRLRAHPLGSSVQVTVDDDGSGIDVDSIAQKAETWMSSSSQEGQPQDPLQILTRSGFSTAETVTEVSGRGVGLDIVQRAVDALGGRLTIHPKGDLGGASFDILVPVSLLTTHGLFVRSHDITFAIALESIERTVRIDCETLYPFAGAYAATMEDGRPILVRDLRSILWNEASPPAGTKNIVVVQRAGQSVGILVDEVLKQEEFVVKKLPWNLERVPGVSGSVVLPNSSLALVVDLPELFEMAKCPTNSPLSPSGRPTVLVVDDSLTSRTLGKNVLTSAGYKVELAVDGVQAWQLLQKTKFSLVVSDIQMPNMDGIALTKKIRSSARLAHTPVVLISSLSSPDDLERGLAAGASEYVVKGTYEQEKLLKAVSKYV